MKTLSEKEFNGFNVNAMFTERAERAKKELSPLMQEIRKYIPQAEYGYHVESGEYPAFYASVSMCARYTKRTNTG